jgi:hypothetical protein
MRRRIAVLTAAALVFTSGVPAAAQIYAPQTLERYFRLEWTVTHDRKGPAIEGYVYNVSRRQVERMRLQIERLDASGTVVGSSAVWVLGTVSMDSRAYFYASVPAAASYRVQVLTFDWAAGGGSGAGM